MESFTFRIIMLATILSICAVLAIQGAPMGVQELYGLEGKDMSFSMPLTSSFGSVITSLEDQELIDQRKGENESDGNDIEDEFDRPSAIEEYDDEDKEDGEYILPSDDWEEEEWEEIWNPNWDDDDWINDFEYAEEAPKLIES